MKFKSETDTFGQALQKLETNLETPVVPGDLSSWISNLRGSIDTVGRLLHDVVVDSHEQCFRQIQEQDPELSPRVQQLRNEDQELLRDFEAVAGAISNLEKQNGDRVANQADSDDKIAEIVQLGLAFVIRTRTLETTLSTWHMEAFQRDRGVGD